jgi:hypothetical protein
MRMTSGMMVLAMTGFVAAAPDPQAGKAAPPAASQAKIPAPATKGPATKKGGPPPPPPAPLTPLGSANQKIDMIKKGQLRPGTTLLLTSEELNVWTAANILKGLGGIRDSRLDLGTGTASASALVDFLKLRTSKGYETNSLIAGLLSGERLVKIGVKLNSSNGNCTIYVTKVELAGLAVGSTGFDFLYKVFFSPLYPQAKLGEPFHLGYNIQKIDVQPDGVRLTVNGMRAAK